MAYSAQRSWGHRMAGGSRQVFISYARSDAERVGTLVEGLRQLRYDAWLDEELTGGQEWWDTVLSQIRASSTVLVVVSLAALESVAVRREYEYGHAVRRPLLPVVVDRVRLETLPPLLAPLQVVDYREPGMKNAFALAAALAALPVPQALPRPLPEPPPIPVSYLSGLMERSRAATLSMDEQLALVARLKVAFSRASEREAAEEVLRSLKNRDDLYQVSAREIESILSPLNSQVSRPQRQETPNARLREESWELKFIDYSKVSAIVYRITFRLSSDTEVHEITIEIRAFTEVVKVDGQHAVTTYSTKPKKGPYSLKALSSALGSDVAIEWTKGSPSNIRLLILKISDQELRYEAGSGGR
jgi:TIR domain